MVACKSLISFPNVNERSVLQSLSVLTLRGAIPINVTKVIGHGGLDIHVKVSSLFLAINVIQTRNVSTLKGAIAVNVTKVIGHRGLDIHVKVSSLFLAINVIQTRNVSTLKGAIAVNVTKVIGHGGLDIHVKVSNSHSKDIFCVACKVLRHIGITLCGVCPSVCP